MSVLWDSLSHVLHLLRQIHSGTFCTLLCAQGPDFSGLHLDNKPPLLPGSLLELTNGHPSRNREGKKRDRSWRLSDILPRQPFLSQTKESSSDVATAPLQFQKATRQYALLCTARPRSWARVPPIFGRVPFNPACNFVMIFLVSPLQGRCLNALHAHIIAGPYVAPEA